MESSLETEAGGEGRCWVQLVVEEGEAGVTASASTGCWSQVFCSWGSLFLEVAADQPPSWGASGAPGGSSPGGAGVKGSPPLHDLGSVLGCQIQHRMSSYI